MLIRAVIFACHCAIWPRWHSQTAIWHTVSCGTLWAVSCCWFNFLKVEMFINTTDRVAHTVTHTISVTTVSPLELIPLSVSDPFGHISRHLAHWKSVCFQNCGTVYFTEDNSPDAYITCMCVHVYITCMFTACNMWLRILWRNARWLRLEAAVVVLHKVRGGGVFNFNYLINWPWPWPWPWPWCMCVQYV
jgi:hypothetical protein